jgi:hypothetical protein
MGAVGAVGALGAIGAVGAVCTVGVTVYHDRTANPSESR